MAEKLQLLLSLADKADELALQFWQSVELGVEYKADNSPVTEADKAIEKVVRQTIAERGLSVQVFGEEEGGNLPAEERIIVDPIDGTRNFLSKMPVFATLLAYELNGEIVSGVVSAPAMGMRWYAEKGGGAFHVNSNIVSEPQRIAVSRNSNLEKAQAYHSSLAGNEISEELSEKIYSVLLQTERQRGVGDFWQHMLVAQGCGDFAIDPVAAPWDLAPVKIIVEEAGGEFSSLSGSSSISEGSGVSSNGLFHAELLAKFS